ncbi:unnamed protein product [Rhodiola kirilowii]
MVPAQATRSPATKSTSDSTPAVEETSKEAKNQAKNSTQIVEPAPYRPPVPFPQRLVGARRDKEFKQFVDKIGALYITLPLTDAITQIPMYAKFMKEILIGKRKIGGTETVPLTEECASVSIMPYSSYAKLNLGDLCPSNVTICLADCSCKLPRGVLKNVPLKVKHIYLTVDFIVLDISEDVDIPIILGRQFLYTAKAAIDMDRGSLALRIGSERVVFNLPNISKSPSLFADCDILDSADAVDPITLTFIEPYRVLQGCPIPMNICAVSIEGAAEAKQTTGSGKEPYKGELKPLHASHRDELLDPGDINKEGGDDELA